MARPRALVLYRERLAAVRENAAAAVGAAVLRSREGGAYGAHDAHDAHDAMDAMDAMDAHYRLGAERAGVACRAGCSWCCHVNVELTTPELRAIVAHVRRAFTDAEQRALEERLGARAAEGDALTDEARWAARVPCALLDGTGHCSVYAVRPLRCRAFHSTDAEACRAATEGDSSVEPPVNAALARLLDAVEAGYDDALGADSEGLHLERALLALLKAEATGDMCSSGANATCCHALTPKSQP